MAIGDQTSTVTSVDRLGPEQLQQRCRSINEQIRSISASAGFDGDLDLVCECSRPGCFEIVRAPSGDFDEVRHVTGRFLVKRDHVNEWSERIVSDTPRLTIVQLRAKSEG